MLSRPLSRYIALASLAAATPAAADVSDFVVTKVQAAGSACPAGNKLRVDGGAGGLTIDWPPLVARLDGKRKLAREACNVTIELTHPEAHLSPTSLEVLTEAELAAGASGQVTAAAHFQGEPATASGRIDVATGAKDKAESIKLSDVWSQGCKGETRTTLIVTLGVLAKGGAGKTVVGAKGPAKLALATKPCI